MRRLLSRLNARSWALLAVGVWAGAIAINRSLRRVEGDSMIPTLRAGQRILVVPRPVARLRPGVVVVLRDPRAPRQQVVKRIAAVAGDRVAGYGAVPAGHVWVLGDNPLASTDSRTFGPVAHRFVVGRVAGVGS